MSFLKEIEPLYQYVELALSGKGYPRKEIIEEIATIDYKLRQKERARIYGNPKAEVYPTDTSCGACIKSMFTNVKRWVDIYNKDLKTYNVDMDVESISLVEFKGVPQKEVKEIRESQKAAEENEFNSETEDSPVLSLNNGEYKAVSVSEMKWGEFKTYCKGLGLSVKGKKRAELEEELKAL